MSDSSSVREFLLSDDFCKQFEKEWNTYNGDIVGAMVEKKKQLKMLKE